MPPRTVLIVDDSPAICRGLAAYLTAMGWAHVLIAPDADAGLVLAQREQPDAIVLDNRMPGGNGIDVLHDLRHVCPLARIVMHTTEDSRALRQRAVALGADAFVTKGRPLDELATELDSVA